MTMVRAEFERQGENRLTGWSQARPEGWSRDRPKELGGKRPAGWVQAYYFVYSFHGQNPVIFHTLEISKLCKIEKKKGKGKIKQKQKKIYQKKTPNCFK